MKRVFELLGILMIGDGLLSVLEPRRHCKLWEVGPEPMKDLVGTFTEHPDLARVGGFVEALAGFWLASKQAPNWFFR